LEEYVPYEAWYSEIKGVRIYFAEIVGIIVLLLCAGDRASRKKDIAMAKEYWAEYNSRLEEV